MKPHRYFQVAAITFALASGNHATAYCQSPQNTPSQVQKVKDRVRKIGVAEDVTVILGAGKEYYGSITDIEPDRFEIAEVDLKRRMAFDYKDVKKVRRGYGGYNFITGKRVNPRTGIIATIAFVGGLFTLVIVALSQAKD